MRHVITSLVRTQYSLTEQELQTKGLSKYCYVMEARSQELFPGCQPFGLGLLGGPSWAGQRWRTGEAFLEGGSLSERAAIKMAFKIVQTRRHHDESLKEIHVSPFSKHGNLSLFWILEIMSQTCVLKLYALGEATGHWIHHSWPCSCSGDLCHNTWKHFLSSNFFPGSLWDGARHVRWPGPWQAKLHLDPLHVAHTVPRRIHGGGLVSVWKITKVITIKVILRPITPYLIPGLLATPLIVHLARALPSVEQETR